MRFRSPTAILSVLVLLTLAIFGGSETSRAAAEQSTAPSKIEITCVDSEATGYGTFQSHNQKVLSNANGIFMTHIRTRNEAYTAQQWRLSRSADGGKNFKTI